MCGIGAVLDPDDRGGAAVARGMLDALAHRGPDGEGARRIGPATLVHTRLAIIDPVGGEQPLVSEDGTITLICNGEIYNHHQLRDELRAKGHVFATGSDSEVILHLYEEEGEACVRRLNGIFGFTLWDDRRRRLVAARDPFGVKPLYWAQDGDRLAIASEVSAVLAAGLGSTEIDPIAYDHFLAWRFVPAPRTLFAGVSKLPAAGLLVARPGVAPQVTSYREAPGALLRDSAAELEVELASRFREAVARQMMSDVPYGAFLSGGIDSAAIVAAMADADGTPPQTFTIGFPGHGERLDERAAARQTADAIGTRHAEVAMRAGDFRGQLQRTIQRLEEPCGVPSAPALLALSEFTSKSIKVVLSGQGADEPMGGYPRHQAAALLRLLALAPGPAAGAVRGAAGMLPRNERAKRAAQLLGPGDDVDRLLRIFEITPATQRAALHGAASADAEAERRSLAEAVLVDVADRDVLDQALYLDTHLFLPDGLLVYGDKMTMAYGLEQRVPFLDVELMRFVERIPGHVRLSRLRRKHLHRAAMAGVVPTVALNRPKLGFSTPYDDWLRAELGAEVERRFADGSELAALADPSVVARLVGEHRRGRADHKRVLYCLLELAEWRSIFAGDGAPGLARAA